MISPREASYILRSGETGSEDFNPLPRQNISPGEILPLSLPLHRNRRLILCLLHHLVRFIAFQHKLTLNNNFVFVAGEEVKWRYFSLLILHYGFPGKVRNISKRKATATSYPSSFVRINFPPPFTYKEGNCAARLFNERVQRYRNIFSASVTGLNIIKYNFGLFM